MVRAQSWILKSSACVFLESQRCVREKAHGGVQCPLANWAPSQQLRERISSPTYAQLLPGIIFIMGEGGCGLGGKHATGCVQRSEVGSQE